MVLSILMAFGSNLRINPPIAGLYVNFIVYVQVNRTPVSVGVFMHVLLCLGHKALSNIVTIIHARGCLVGLLSVQIFSNILSLFGVFPAPENSRMSSELSIGKGSCQWIHVEEPTCNLLKM